MKTVWDAGEGGQALAKVASIRTENKNPLLEGCHFQIACDVTILYAEKTGLPIIYGPQKRCDR